MTVVAFGIVLCTDTYTGWPYKKLATSELSLNHIKNLSVTLDFKIRFDRKTSTTMLSVGIK